MRDLKTDLEICNKATPGPWQSINGECDCDRECGNNQPCYKKLGECEHIQQTVPANVTKVFTIDCGDYMGLNNNDAEFIAAAREGWPEAIERAINAEEELAEAQADNAGIIDKLKRYMRDVYDYDMDGDNPLPTGVEGKYCEGIFEAVEIIKDCKNSHPGSALLQEVEQLRVSDASKEQYTMELYNRAKEAEDSLKQYKRALELACTYIVKDRCMIFKEETVTEWIDLFLSQAKAGNSNNE